MSEQPGNRPATDFASCLRDFLSPALFRQAYARFAWSPDQR